MQDFNVLITGCSKHSKGIIDCLKDNEDKANVKVFGVDCNKDNLLREGVDGYAIVPRIDHPLEYISSLTNICKKFQVDIIIPYITAELGLLSLNQSIIEDTGVKLSISPFDSIVVANDKGCMAKRFASLMPIQTVAHNIDDIKSFAEMIGYPNKKFCCKISNGCGGAGFAIVDDDKADDIRLFNKTGVNRYIRYEDLMRIIEKDEVNIILQEYVKGLDYSVCVLADGKKNLCKVGYVGYSMQYGAVISGEIWENKEAYDIADYVTAELGLEGNACFDFILDKKGHAVLLEVNPRINASLPFVAAAGVNMPYLRCKQLLGYEISENQVVNYGLKMQKYYESKYYF